MLSYLVESFPLDFPVLCSELIDMISEYRVYCIDGAIKGIANYKKPEEDPGVTIDMAVVEEAVKLFYAQPGAPRGCSMDFSIVKKDTEGGGPEYQTALIEVNDGFALGWYMGVAPEDYTDLLIARWKQLMGL